MNFIMKEESVISPLTLAIIGLVSKQPSSGYDLRKLFAETPIGAFSSSPGAVYPALKRCKASGWIIGHVDNSKELRPREIFELTAGGHALLKQELSRLVTQDDVIWRSDSLILRFSFMDGILSDQEITDFLTQYLEEHRLYLSSLEAHRASMPDDPRCGVLAMECGMERCRANITWASKALDFIQ